METYKSKGYLLEEPIEKIKLPKLKNLSKSIKFKSIYGGNTTTLREINLSNNNMDDTSKINSNPKTSTNQENNKY